MPRRTILRVTSGVGGETAGRNLVACGGVVGRSMVVCCCDNDRTVVGFFEVEVRKTRLIWWRNVCSLG